MRHGSAPTVNVSKFIPRHASQPPKKKTRNISATFNSGLGKNKERNELEVALGLSYEEVPTLEAPISPISRTQSHCSVTSAISVDSAPEDGRVTPTPSMTTSYAESFISNPYPTTPSSSRTPSVCIPEAQEVELENSAPSRPSWVPYLGKMAKAVVATSMHMSMPFSEKRKKETKTDSFAPTGPTPLPTREELAQLSEEAAMERRRQWALEQQRRVTECARLCSQWPHSGYNQSKWGPNGSKGFYEPQSYANPHYVASLMARQADLERNLLERSALFFTCRRYRASSENSSVDSFDSAQTSPDVSSSLAADLNAAMESPLVFPVDSKVEESKLEHSLTDLDVFAKSMALDAMEVDRPMASSEILQRPPVLVRPNRAQSCGAKRPLASQGSEEEKRRKVDEAMVVEDAVNDGVIMPADNRVDAGSKGLSSSVPDLSATKVQQPGTAVFGHFVKTSDTHPIIISPFFPHELIPTIAQSLVVPPEGVGSSPLMLASKIDIPSLLLSHAAPNTTSPTIVPSPVKPAFGDLSSNGIKLGNLLLSSCPGKRLRMEGPVRGRGPVCRDLATDLRRIKSEGVGALVWCVSSRITTLLILAALMTQSLPSLVSPGRRIVRSHMALV